MATVSTAFPLAQMFPSHSYGRARLDHKLHYLIALNQPIDSINKVLEKGVDLEAKDPNYDLTPLAVAAMAGNGAVVDRLLRAKADPLPLDKVGWTPLHYLELSGNDEIKKMILTAAKTRRLPNLKELHRTLNPRRPKPNEPIGLVQNLRNRQSPLTAAEFSQMTGLAYSEDLVGTPKGLIDYWVHAVPQNDPRFSYKKQKYVAERFENQRDNLPKLAIKKESHQIIATSRIPSCGMIGFHGGKITPVEEGDADKSCRLEEIDASQATNLAAMIGDGIPNCQITTVRIDGIQYHVVIATRTIEKGEELRMDFGPLHVSKYKYKAPSAETIEFYRQNSPSKLYEEIHAYEDSSPREQIEKDGLRHQLRYLFSTPFLVLELLRQNMLQPEELQKILHEPDFPRTVEMDLAQELSYETIFSCWQQLNNKLKELPPGLAKEINENIYTHIKRHRIHSVVEFLDQLSVYIPQIVDRESWERVFSILEENSLVYEIIADWIKDETNDETARVALQSVDPRTRRQFIANTEFTIRDKFPNKKIPFDLIIGAVAISDWATDPTHAPYHLIALEKLSCATLTELYKSKRAHIEHKHPRLLGLFDAILSRVIERKN